MATTSNQRQAEESETLSIDGEAFMAELIDQLADRVAERLVEKLRENYADRT